MLCAEQMSTLGESSAFSAVGCKVRAHNLGEIGETLLKVDVAGSRGSIRALRERLEPRVAQAPAPALAGRTPGLFASLGNGLATVAQRTLCGAMAVAHVDLDQRRYCCCCATATPATGTPAWVRTAVHSRRHRVPAPSRLLLSAFDPPLDSLSARWAAARARSSCLTHKAASGRPRITEGPRPVRAPAREPR